jgi:hypothetical protein
MGSLVLIREILFPASNHYAHYNEIILNKQLLRIILFNGFNFALFIFFILAIMGLITRCSNMKVISLKTLNNRIDFVFILILFIASISPYVLANKSPAPFDLFDWTWRHTFLLVIPFTVIALKIERDSSVKTPIKIVRCTFGFVSIFIYFGSTMMANYGHVQTMVFDQYVIELLSENKSVWGGSQILCFTSSSKRLNHPRFYELNELAWESTGKTDWQFYSDDACNSGDIPSGWLRSSPYLSELTQRQWEGVYMGGNGNSRWLAIYVTGQLDFSDVIAELFGKAANPLVMNFSKLEQGKFVGVEEPV